MRGCLAFALLILAGAPRGAQAWTQDGHEQITQSSVILLIDVETSQEYEEARDFEFRITEGVRDEDDGTKPLSHFFNPRTSRTSNPGPGLRFRIFDAGDGSISISQQGSDGLTEAKERFNSAKQAYKSGNKTEAYKLLGRFLHLLGGDFFQPQHVHDDPHAPEVNIILASLTEGRANTIEDFFQNNLGIGSLLNIPTSLSSISVVKAPLDNAKIEAAGRAIANATFNAATFGGSIAPGTNVTPGAQGSISTIKRFDGGALTPVFKAADPESSDPTLKVGHWEIEVDNAVPLFFDPNFRSDFVSILPMFGGLPKIQDWWELPSDEEQGGQQFYFDAMNLVRAPDGKPLDESLTRARVPLAVRNGAGLLREMIRSIEPVEPFIEEIRENDLQGRLINNDGAAGSEAIFIKAVDPTNAENPTASGIRRIVLTQTSGGGYSSTATFSGISPATTIFPQTSDGISKLPEGGYVATAHDGTGNESTLVDFCIEQTPGTHSAASVFNESNEPVLDGDGTKAATIKAVGEACSGVQQIELGFVGTTDDVDIDLPPPGGFTATTKSVRTFADPQTRQEVTLPDVAAGDNFTLDEKGVYLIKVTNFSGTVSTSLFYVDRTAPALQAFGPSGNFIKGQDVQLNATKAVDITISAEDALSLLGEMRLSKIVDGTPTQVCSGFTGGEFQTYLYDFPCLDGLEPGLYSIDVDDEAGNIGSVGFKIERDLAKLTLFDDNLDPITVVASDAVITTQTHTAKLYIEGMDDPAGSGIASIRLKQTDGAYDETFPFDPPNLPFQRSTITVVGGSPPEGTYTATVTDLAGNQTVVNFKWDRAPPDMTVLDVVRNDTIKTQGNTACRLYVDGKTCVTDSANFTVTADGGLSGLARLDIFEGDPNNGGSLLRRNTEFFPGQHTYVATDQDMDILDAMSEGHIYVVAYDLARNTTTIDFLVRRGIPPQVQAPTGDTTVSNTPATAAWSKQPYNLAFAGNSPTVGLSSLTLYSDLALQSKLFAVSCKNKQITDTVVDRLAFILPGLADRASYAAVAADVLERQTTMFFHVDSVTPRLALKQLTETAATIEFTDATAGLGFFDNFVPDGSFIYTGPAYPPGAASETKTFARGGTDGAAIAMDRAGNVTQLSIPAAPGPSVFPTVEAANGGIRPERPIVETFQLENCGGIVFNINAVRPPETAPNLLLSRLNVDVRELTPVGLDTKLPGSSWRIDTDAVFTGTASLRVAYNPAEFGLSETDEIYLHLVKVSDTGSYEDITVFVDTGANVVTGWINDLSEFPHFSLIFSTDIAPTPPPPPDGFGPQAFFAVRGNRFGGEPLYISGGSLVVLGAADVSVAREFPSGAENAYFKAALSQAGLPSALNDATLSEFGTYSTPFSLPEGQNFLAYGAKDNGGNFSPLFSKEIRVDATAPTASFIVNGSSDVAGDGTVSFTQGVEFFVSAQDPGDFPSGVAKVRMFVDVEPASCAGTVPNPASPAGSCENPFFTAPVALAVGSHRITYSAADNVQNEGASQTVYVNVYEEDTTPPAFSNAEAGPAGSGQFAPVSQPIPALTADARITVRDLGTGLNVSGAAQSELQAIPGTVRLYHFSEGSGAATADASGAGLNATLVNTPFVPGQIGTALSFNGVDSYATASGANLPSGSAARSIQLWFRSTDPKFQTLFAWGQDSFLKLSAVDTQEGAFGQSGVLIRWGFFGVDFNLQRDFPILDGQYHFLTVSYANGVAKIYLDGVFEGAKSVGSINTPPGTQLFLGNRPSLSDASYFHGDIDEFRVLDFEVTAEQVRADFEGVRSMRAYLSRDGGVSYTELPSGGIEVTGTDGTTDPQTMTVRGLPLLQSLGPTDGSQKIVFSAADLAANVGVSTQTLLVNLNPVTELEALAPADGGVLSGASPTLAWRLDANIPAGAIDVYEVELSAAADFSALAVSSTTNTPAFSLAGVASESYYWRVRAKDNFGTYSPYTPARSFTLDLDAPAFSAPQAAAAGTGEFVPVTAAVSSTTVDVRATVQDPVTGLRSVGALSGLEAIPGTVRLYHFDEGSGSTLQDASGAGLNATLVNTSFVQGKVGSALAFNGVDSYVVASGANLPVGNEARSIQLWFRSTDPKFQTLFAWGQDSFLKLSAVDTQEGAFGQEGVLIRWGFFGVDFNLQRDFPILDGQYHFLTVSYANGVARIYLDGVFEGAKTVGSINTPPGTQLFLGNRPSLNDGSYFHGDIDEFRVLNFEISAAQVAADYASFQGGRLARYSTDGGATFADVPAGDVGFTAAEGSVAPETLTAFNLNLVESLSVDEPSNVVEFSASDLAGNATSFSFGVLVDTTPPSAQITSPSAGAVLTADKDAIEVAYAALDRLDPAPLVSAFLIQREDRGRPSTFTVTAVPVASGQSLDPRDIDDGVWELTLSATDFAGNAASALSGRFEVVHDSVAPSAVADFAVVTKTTHSLTLAWTAPGDNGGVDVIEDAEVRIHYLTEPPSGGAQPPAFSTSAAQAVFTAAGLTPGQGLTHTLEGLQAETTYYVTVFTRDTARNWSAPSNAAEGRTFFLAISPDGQANVASETEAVAVSTVSVAASSSAFSVAVDSQAFSPVLEDFYELTSGLIFEQPAVLSFFFDPTVVDTSSVFIYTFDGTQWSSASIVNQEITLLAADLALITGEIFHTSLYSPMVRDSLPPVSSAAVAGVSAVLDGGLYLDGEARIVLSAEDRAPLGGVAAGTDTIRFDLDGGGQAVYLAPIPPGPGAHVLTFFAEDKVGNTEEARAMAFRVDAAKPLISLSVDGPYVPTADGLLVPASTVTVTLIAEEPEEAGVRSGLAAVSYSINGASVAVSFVPGGAAAEPVELFLESGVHVLNLRAEDRIGNVEERTVRIAVGAFDAGPLLGHLFGSCTDITVSGSAGLTGNLQTNGRVSVLGSAVVDGDVAAGEVVTRGGGEVRGTTTLAPDSVDCLPIDLASVRETVEAANDNAGIPPEFLKDGVLTLKAHDSLKLAAGRYLLSGVSIKGGATLLTSGIVDVFVRGKISVEGNAFVNQSETTDLVIFSDSPEKAEIGGKAVFRGVLYAPEAELEVEGAADVRGHFFAKSVKAAGGTANTANPSAEEEVVATAYVPEEGGVVRAEEEATGEVKSKAEVVIPPGALTAAKRITIAKESVKNDFEEVVKGVDAQSKGLETVSEGVQYGPEGTVFEEPVVIGIAYDPDTLPEGVEEKDLKVHYWNPESKEWEELASSNVDPKAKVVRAATKHFSLYKVLAPSPKAQLAAQQAAFSEREVYVYPNPAVRGAAPTLHIEVGIADSVAIKIYNVAGQEVHSASLSDPPGIVADQNGSDYAYEYQWAGHIPSGVYLYVITAEKSGESPIRSTGKFAVVR